MIIGNQSLEISRSNHTKVFLRNPQISHTWRGGSDPGIAIRLKVIGRKEIEGKLAVKN
jgi:hypothetical protein